MNLMTRARNIITNPRLEWTIISAEPANPSQIITGYVLPLAGLAAIAAFIGYGLIGVGFLGVRIAGFNWGIYYALNVLIGAIVSVYVTAFVVDMLAPSFSSTKNFGRSLQLVAYSFTPVWIGGMLAIFPPIAIIGALFGLYGFYLMYIGMPIIKNTPEDKHIGYFITIIILTFIVYFVIGWILRMIFFNIFGLTYGNTINIRY